MPDLQYAKVVGRFAVTRGDGPDLDDFPDTVFCDEGTVTFSPLLKKMTADPDNDVPLTIVNMPIVATIGPDGWVSHSGLPYVWLVDLGDASIDPAIPRTSPAYSVTFSNVKTQGQGYDLPGLLIHPIAGSELDLSLVMQNA